MTVRGRINDRKQLVKQRHIESKFVKKHHSGLSSAFFVILLVSFDSWCSLERLFVMQIMMFCMEVLFRKKIDV